MWELAIKMYKQGGDFTLHYSRLEKPKRGYLKKNFNCDKDYYKLEATTCSFLNRDSKGMYKFIHKSFMEYFIAECFFYYNFVKNIEHQTIDFPDFNNEVIFFLNQMIFPIKPNLFAIDLSGTNLSQLDFNNANLHKANLSKANLTGANLSFANLIGANLREANLTQASLRYAELINADLLNAILLNADLDDANLMKASIHKEALKNARSVKGIVHPDWK